MSRFLLMPLKQKKQKSVNFSAYSKYWRDVIDYMMPKHR